jgi:MFS family permease
MYDQEMHEPLVQRSSNAADRQTGPWYRDLTRYHWFVLIVASLGWLFDTMDQQLFNLARRPAIAELLKITPGDPAGGAVIAEYAGYATMIFMIGWASGGLIFGVLGDRIGRVKTMIVTILLYSMFTGLSTLSTGVGIFRSTAFSPDLESAGSLPWAWL